MKKNMKKIVSLVLAMVMVFAMCVTAFADEKTSTLKINTTAGHTYKVYQMLTGDVSSLKGGSGTLANVKLGKNNSADSVAEFDAAIKDKDGNYLTDAALGDAAAAFIKGDAEKDVTGDGSAIGITVADGYYVVVDTWTGAAIEGEQLSRYMVAVVGDTEMTPKAGTTDIDKKIIDEDANAAIDASKKTDTAAIGDVINYEVTGNVPNYTGYKYYYYVVNDTLSKGLTLDQDSFVVTVDKKNLTKGTDYYVYVTTNTDGTTTFELAFKDMVDSGYEIGADISIKYNATLNKDAEVGNTANTNTAKLIYSNNPSESTRKDKDGKPGTPGSDVKTGETPDRITKTYTTKLTIQKTDADTKNFIDALKGATFTLTGTGLNDVVVTTETVFVKAAANDSADYYLLKDGTYTKDEPITEGDGKNVDSYAETTPSYVTKTVVSVSDKDSGETCNITAVVDAKGQITFTGLNAGTYKLSETNTPAGYNTCADIEFIISATQTGSTGTEGGKITWSDNSDDIELDETNGVFNATIVNQKGSILPSTGGIGTTIFYVLGGILVVGAAILLVTKRRMSAR